MIDQELTLREVRESVEEITDSTFQILTGEMISYITSPREYLAWLALSSLNELESALEMLIDLEKKEDEC